MALFACIRQQNKIMLTTKILTSNLELDIQIALGRSSHFLARVSTLGVLGQLENSLLRVFSASILHSLNQPLCPRAQVRNA